MEETAGLQHTNLFFLQRRHHALRSRPAATLLPITCFSDMAINVSTGLNAWVPGNNVQPDTVEPDIAVRAPRVQSPSSSCQFQLQLPLICKYKSFASLSLL